MDWKEYQGSDKPGKPWKKGFFEKAQEKPGKVREKNWKKWNSGKTQGTFLYDGENFPTDFWNFQLSRDQLPYLG